MNQLIVVTGVSCSGKDFLLEKIKPLLPREIEVVSFGEELYRTVSATQAVGQSRDQLRKVGYEFLKKPVQDLVGRIIERQPLVLNTHTVFNARGDLIFTLTTQYRLLPKSYIHVSAPVEEIVERRSQRERWGEQDSERQIEFHQDLSAFVTARIARDLGSSFVQLWNHRDNLETNLELLQRELSTLL